jgi:ribA/ribD-fused uncharacterized protein
MINEFRGKYFFLSNFYEADILFLCIPYKNNEAAFQAQKVLGLNERSKFCSLSPSEAKRLGRSVKLRPDWEELKDDLMYEICKAKFAQNEDLKNKLIATGEEELIEGNVWRDTYWGVCNGVGLNKLGKILMKVREELKTQAKTDFIG